MEPEDQMERGKGRQIEKGWLNLKASEVTHFMRSFFKK